MHGSCLHEFPVLSLLSQQERGNRVHRATPKPSDCKQPLKEVWENYQGDVSHQLCCFPFKPCVWPLSRGWSLSPIFQRLFPSLVSYTPPPPFQNLAGFLLQFCKHHSHLGAKINWLEVTVDGASGYLVNFLNQLEVTGPTPKSSCPKNLLFSISGWEVGRGWEMRNQEAEISERIQKKRDHVHAVRRFSCITDKTMLFLKLR